MFLLKEIDAHAVGLFRKHVLALGRIFFAQQTVGVDVAVSVVAAAVAHALEGFDGSLKVRLCLGTAVRLDKIAAHVVQGNRIARRTLHGIFKHVAHILDVLAEVLLGRTEVAVALVQQVAGQFYHIIAFQRLLLVGVEHLLVLQYLQQVIGTDEVAHLPCHVLVKLL